MKVLVLGTSGYIGSATARSLATAGHQVSGLARTPETEAWLEREGYDAVRGSLADIDALGDAIAGFDGIVFTPRLTFAEEGETLRALLDMIEGTGKAFAYVSGTGVFMIETPLGEWRDETFAEDDPFTPLPWIASRVAVENHVLAASERGIRSMVVRPSHVWGRGGSTVFRAIMGCVRKTGASCYLGQGLHVQSHVHVDDVGDVIALAVERGHAGAAYHAVGGEVNYRFMAQVAGEVAGCPTRSVTLREAQGIWGEMAAISIFGCSMRARTVQTREHLGWAPKYGDLTEDLRNGGYLTQQEDEALDRKAQARMGLATAGA